MRTEDEELGMLVEVHRGPKEPGLRGRIGIFEVRFGKNEQLELLWASEFEESGEFYQHYG